MPTPETTTSSSLLRLSVKGFLEDPHALQLVLAMGTISTVPDFADELSAIATLLAHYSALWHRFNPGCKRPDDDHLIRFGAGAS